MSINPLSSSIVNMVSPAPITLDKGTGTDGASGSFADIFTESFKTATETDFTDKASAIELLTGQADDMSGLLLDAEKAQISLNLALQLRNKVVDAYNEIMRMQV